MLADGEKFGRLEGRGRKPTCHPERAHEAHGLCVNCYQKTRDSYREKYAEQNLKKSLRKAGLSREAYDALLERQDGKCAICGSDPNGQGRLHIDHDHNTGRARGLLCSNCNPGLGYFKDDPELLGRAARYLADY